MCLDFGDVVRAYFHAKARTGVYVDVSMEDFEEGKCGLLKKAKYGTRDAAQNWEMEYTEMMIGAGVRQGLQSACVFYHELKTTRVVVQGDDFTILGASKSLDWFRGVFQQCMGVKFESRLERGLPGSVSAGEARRRGGESLFRAAAARGNHLGQDRMGMQFAAKQVSSSRQSPRSRIGAVPRD